ncbi:hypothetical protein IW492_12040 [Enterococcus sp. BWB1-3]|uniref:hypothetical protein n=1 Tax=unclassified Enterococcus TaxID=2608891 RepID=UPI001924097B|nr:MULTISPECIES: hypothetical protein [unclassified Enterococcus]MBL1229964.1 hypothetical protein [Enterococcus sp. BWB1-3]MCB5952962.1 hypothetical protein [Enterococcus sp. BWT-B8]
MLLLGAFGVYFFLKEDAVTVKIPKKFAEPIPSKAVVEGEYVYLGLNGLWNVENYTK